MGLCITANSIANHADMFEVALVVGPDTAGSRFFRPNGYRPGHLDYTATLSMGPEHGPDFKVELTAGPEALKFLRGLLEDVATALEWADDAMCDHCEEDLREPHSRACADCRAEAQRINEHVREVA